MRWALKFKIQALGISSNLVSIVLGAQVELRAGSSWHNLNGCVVVTDKAKPKSSKVPKGEPLHPDLYHRLMGFYYTPYWVASLGMRDLVHGPRSQQNQPSPTVLRQRYKQDVGA